MVNMYPRFQAARGRQKNACAYWMPLKHLGLYKLYRVTVSSLCPVIG